MSHTIDRGKLVNDAVVIDAIGERLQQPDCELGFVLEGFPRTTMQCQGLQDMLAREGDCIWKVLPPFTELDVNLPLIGRSSYWR